MEPNSSTVKKAESPQEKLSPMEKWSASRMKFLAQEKLKMSNEESSELKSSPTPAEQTTPACTECQELNKTMQCMIGDNLYGFHDLADIKELLPKVIRHHKENLKYLLGDEGDAHARFKIMEEIESRRSWWDGLNYKMDDYIEDEKSHVSFLEGQLKNVVEMEKSFNGFEPMFHRFGKLIASFKYTRQEEDRSQMLCFVGSWQFGFHDTKQVVEFLVTSIEDMHYQLRHKQEDPIQTRTELGVKVKAKMAYDVRIMKRDVAFLKKCLRYLNQLNMRMADPSFEQFLDPNDSDHSDSSFELIQNPNGSETNDPNVVNVSKKNAPKQKKRNDLDFSVEIIAMVVLLALLVSLVIFKDNSGTPKFTDEQRALINKTRESLQKMKCVGEVPDKFMDKWIPKVSEFKGVDELLPIYGAHRKEIENFMYTATPEFVKGDGIEFQLVKGSWKSPKNHFMPNCVYSEIKIDKSLKNDPVVSQTVIYIKNGELYIYEQGKLTGHDYKYTQVYYIPDKDLI